MGAPGRRNLNLILSTVTLQLKNITLRQLAAIALAGLMTALGACSSRTVGPDEPDEPATVYRAGFFVTVGDADPTSRTPDGSYMPGEGLENHIDIAGGDLRVVLFNTDGSFLTEITDFTIIPVATYESSKRYYLNGATSADISSGKFKILFLANWRHRYPAEWTLENVWNQKYTFDGTGKITKEQLIPLYGIKDIAIAGGIKPDVAADLGTLHLLRAMAKIEVIFEDDFWTFKSLQLTNYNTTGFCAPNNVKSETDYVHGNWIQDYTPAHIPTDTQKGGSLDFVPVDTTHWVLYVPEYSNTTASSPEAQIKAVFNEGLSDTKTIRFLQNNNESRDILRNYWYRFTVKKKDETSDIEVEVDVLPYHTIELDPTFGLDDPDEGSTDSDKKPDTGTDAGSETDTDNKA